MRNHFKNARFAKFLLKLVDFASHYYIRYDSKETKCWQKKYQRCWMVSVGCCAGRPEALTLHTFVPFNSLQLYVQIPILYIPFYISCRLILTICMPVIYCNSLPANLQLLRLQTGGFLRTNYIKIRATRFLSTVHITSFNPQQSEYTLKMKHVKRQRRIDTRAASSNEDFLP